MPKEIKSLNGYALKDETARQTLEQEIANRQQALENEANARQTAINNESETRRLAIERAVEDEASARTLAIQNESTAREQAFQNEAIARNNEISLAINGVINKFGGSLIIEELWKNASPTSNFPRQEVEIDVSDYDFLMVEVHYAYTVDETIICFGKPNKQFLLTATAWASYSNVGYNSRLMVPTANGIQIESAYTHNMASTSSGTQNNDYLIPCVIYGIKVVK